MLFFVLIVLIKPRDVRHYRSEIRVYQGALSICMEKPVVLVGQEMEQSFPLGIFRKKGIAADVGSLPFT